MAFYHSFTNYLDISTTSVATAVAIVLLVIIYNFIQNRNVLPGPKGLPYLGLYPFLTDENFLSKFEKYKKEYGDMFSFTCTGRLYINLSSIKAMREIQLQKSDCFMDRYKNSSILVEMFKKGIFFVNGEPWKVLRKFFIQKFKDYGLNAVRGDMAGPVYDSLNDAVENVKVLHENPINIVEFLNKHSSYVTRKILFGVKGVTDEEVTKMLIAFGGALNLSLLTALLDGPLARFLFYIKPSFRENIKHANTLKSIILTCTKRIQSSMKEYEPTCIVEEFYKERNERRRNNDPSWKYFSDEALVESLFQFVGDGILTVSGLIAGMLNALVEYPDEQEKIYSEIMEVIGPNRQPTAEDKPNLPYLNAFLNEYTRTTKFLTFLSSLECTKETTVRGYRIPKGAITLLNFWSAHHDEETFEDPNEFRPSRYLHSEGKPKAESPVLFGMGKRICIGEPFTMLQSFLFLATIVKNFKVVSSNAQSDKTFDFLVAGKLELTFVPREEV